MRGGSLESGEHVPGPDDQAQKQMDAVEQLGVFLGDGVLKRKIEQTLEEAFSFGHVGCLQNMRCIRHSFPPKFGMSSLGALSLSLAPNGLCEKPLCPLPLPNPLPCLSQAAPPAAPIPTFLEWSIPP